MGFDKVRKRQGYVDNDTGNVEVEVGSRPEDLSRAAAAKAEVVRRLVHGQGDAPGLMEQGGQAERNFVAALQKVGQSGSASDLALMRDVLGELPAERSFELLRMAGNPQSLVSAISGPESLDIDAGVGDASALDQESQLTPQQRKSLMDRQEYALTRADKSKPVREYDASTFQNAHPLDRNGTYDPQYAKFMRDSFESRAKGAARYGEDVAFRDRPAYQQKDILFAMDPALGKKVFEFQEGALGQMPFSADLAGKLSPEQMAALTGVAPDQLTPEILHRLYGVPLSADQIRGLPLTTRTQLVGYPQLTDSEWQKISEAQSDFDQTRRQQSSADQKIGTLMAAVQKFGADPSLTVNPAAFMPPWRGQFQTVVPGQGLQPSPFAPSGRFLAGQIATAARQADPDLINALTPLLDRSSRYYATMPPQEGGFRNTRNRGEAEWSQHLMQPGARGLKTLTDFSERMPFPIFTDQLIRRAGDAPATMGDIDIDTTPQVDAQPPMPMNTPEEPVMPQDSDLGMYMAPRGMNPSVLAALLA